MLPKRKPERREAPPGSPWANLEPPGATLAEHHGEYLAARGVDEDLARGAFFTARKPSEIPAAFSEYQRRNAPALIAEMHSPDRETVCYQIHPDHPRKNRKGKIAKWMSPPAESARIILGVYPGMVDEVRTGSRPLWIVEGATRAAALAGFGIPAVAIPGVWNWQKAGEPLECWRYVNLRGRLALVAFDADARTNENVQEALARLVAFLEASGATVRVVRIPEIDGDPQSGLDDAIAHGHHPEALAQNAEPFVRVNVGRRRLKRIPELRQGIGALRMGLPALETRKARECSAYAVARYLVEDLAPAIGTPHKDGVRMGPGLRRVAAGVRIGVGTVSRALAYLELEAKFLKMLKPASGPEPAVYVLLYPSRGGSGFVEHMREQGEAEKESQEQRGQKATSLSKRDSSSSVPQTRGVVKSAAAPEKVPALRNSKLVHTWARKDGRRVVVDSVYVGRYGKKKEAIIRYVLERGDPDETEIHEKFGSRSSRLRDFRRTWIKPMLDDGVLVADGGSILPAPDWPEALERVRERTDEELDNRLQDRKIADQQKAYRRAKENPTDPTPELAGPERTAEIVKAAEKRDEIARLEEQRRKVGMTPDVFLADAVRDVSGFGWRELRALWQARGGRTEDLRRAVKGTYRFRRDGDGPLYVEKCNTTPEPEPAPVAVLREPVEDWRSHPLDCECDDCLYTPLTRYATAYVGSGA